MVFAPRIIRHTSLLHLHTFEQYRWALFLLCVWYANDGMTWPGRGMRYTPVLFPVGPSHLRQRHTRASSVSGPGALPDTCRAVPTFSGADDRNDRDLHRACGVQMPMRPPPHLDPRSRGGDFFPHGIRCALVTLASAWEATPIHATDSPLACHANGSRTRQSVMACDSHHTAGCHITQACQRSLIMIGPRRAVASPQCDGTPRRSQGGFGDQCPLRCGVGLTTGPGAGVHPLKRPHGSGADRITTWRRRSAGTWPSSNASDTLAHGRSVGRQRGTND
jgi:hypothetical protein